MKYKTTLGNNIFEEPKYRAILQGGRWPNKTYDMVMDLIDFYVNHPNENTLFCGKNIQANIDIVMKHLGLKWYIYIEQPYETLERNQFVGKARW